MKKILLVIAFTVSFFLQARCDNYNVSLIPESLKREAKSVVRKDNKVFEISGIGSANLSVDYAVTILEEGAYERAIFSQSYDKFHKIKNIKAAIYDGTGKLVKQIKFDDIIDMSIIQGAESFDDNRLKYFDPEYKYFPFTVEYSYTMQFSGLLGYPDWSPYRMYNESVEHSLYQVITDENFDFKYLEKNGAPKARISVEKGKKIHQWEVTELPARKYEYFAPYDWELPTVYLAPLEFEFDGHKGSCHTWNELGAWFAKLNDNRNNLPEAAINEVKNLVAGVEDPIQKIETLYRYMQNKTRYVSIQLGIGGLQPFDANTVERLGYGDCKALSNYMKSILEVVDISSNYVLVNAGEDKRPVFVDFPSYQFNHAFLMVPMNNDTVWLECTSQHVPYNYNGTFTDDRDVLVINENGGSIVRTPSYDVKNNFEKREVTVTIDQSGNAAMTGKTIYSGAKYDNVFGYLFLDKKDVENALLKRIDIADFSIKHFNYQDNKRSIEEELSLFINNYAKLSRDNLILPLNLMNKITQVPKKDDDRKVDVFIRRSFAEKDVITYQFPPNIHVGALPDDIFIESKFGKFKVSVIEKEGSIEYVRELEVYKGTYPPSDYNVLIDFLSSVSKADRMKVLLVGGT